MLTFEEASCALEDEIVKNLLTNDNVFLERFTERLNR
jgi:hypothetical protein